MKLSWTYHSATDRVDEDGFTLGQAGEFEQQDVGDGVVHGDGRRVQMGHVLGQFVDVFGGHGHQFGPGAVLRERHYLITNLEMNTTINFQLFYDKNVEDNLRNCGEHVNKSSFKFNKFQIFTGRFV